MENTPVILPESMIRAEIEGRWRRLAQYYNTSPEAIMQLMAIEGEEKQKEWRSGAEKALHSRLIIETLIEEQKFDVTDADIEKEIETIAAEHNADIEEVKKSYQSEEAKIYLQEDIKERRLIDIMFAENTLKKGKKENYLDFMTDNG
jgi:trigger factor